MNNAARKNLWEQLRMQRLVSGEFPTETATPWYVRIMLGVAGWIGALFILGFIGTGLAMVMRSSGAAAVAAVFCCAAAYAAFQLAEKNDFSNQFGLATGIAGQALFAIAIFQPFSTENFSGYLLFCAIEIGLTLIMPNFLHRMFTTMGAIGALSTWLVQAGLFWLALPIIATGFAMVWRSEKNLIGRTELWQPVGYALALGVVQSATMTVMGGKLMDLIHHQENGWLHKHGTEISSILVGLLVVAVAIHILSELDISTASAAGIILLCGSCTVLLVSFPAHGLSAALLLVIIGFAGGNRILLGLGLLAMASFLSHYYYQMNESLLVKAVILAITGAFLLGGRWGLQLLFPIEESDHA
jgi:hypothetical protein